MDGHDVATQAKKHETAWVKSDQERLQLENHKHRHALDQQTSDAIVEQRLAHTQRENSTLAEEIGTLKRQMTTIHAVVKGRSATGAMPASP
jgi:hypothetical protein